MKIGIDTYTFHRYFGEVKPPRGDPGKRWTIYDFIAFSREAGVEGVCLGVDVLPSVDLGFLRELGMELSSSGLEPVLAWSHGGGMVFGKGPAALESLKAHIPAARVLGSKVMRICASNIRYSAKLEAQYANELPPLLRDAVQDAADQGIALAIENHIDLTADSLVRLLESVPGLMVTMDTGNFIRVGDDPVEAARKVAARVATTHIKDVRADPDALRQQGSGELFRSTPIGKGDAGIATIVEILRTVGYSGLLAIEIDTPTAEWCGTPEEELVRMSIQYLRGLVG